MATWMVHLRIADGIMKEIPKLERQEFIMGNIAPDSGVPNEDWSVFTPNTNCLLYTSLLKESEMNCVACCGTDIGTSRKVNQDAVSIKTRQIH